VTAAPPLVVVAGVTATGKTELAIRLGEAIAAAGRPVTIISADSRQVYRGLDIGTAKVTAADRERVPHAGIDLADPDQPFSVADFVTHAGAVLDEVAAQDGVALLAGGTGLYLRAVARGLDIDVEVLLNGEVVSRPPYRTMYWSPEQMLAHLTVNGASLRTGDLFASGTISGPDAGQRGSFLELSWGGKEPFGTDLWEGGRTFLEDGDEVVLRYTAPGTGGGRIGLGEVVGRVEPARA